MNLASPKTRMMGPSDREDCVILVIHLVAIPACDRLNCCGNSAAYLSCSTLKTAVLMKYKLKMNDNMWTEATWIIQYAFYNTLWPMLVQFTGQQFRISKSSTTEFVRFCNITMTTWHQSLLWVLPVFYSRMPSSLSVPDCWLLALLLVLPDLSETNRNRHVAACQSATDLSQCGSVHQSRE